VSYIRRLEERAFASARSLIAVDHGQADILRSDFGVPAGKIDVAANGIDTAAIAALSEKPPTVDLPQPYFVVPRRLVKKNGIEVALQAMARRRSSTVLAVAGDGPLRGELERAAAALGIAERVRFLGNLPSAALMPLIRGARGVLIPSVPIDGVIEATSLAALETLACGAPLVASDIGGLREIMARSGVGFPFPAGDAAALARELEDLERLSPDALAHLRRGARQAAAAFDVRHWFAAIEKIYGNTLTSAAAASATGDCNHASALSV
jgi:glycosyltransferase involved in cell wall biosynthesis